jgi:hypothetical protein
LDPAAAKFLRRITRLDVSLAIAALAMVNAIAHPSNGAAARGNLPPLGWVFLQIGMGATLGFLVFAIRATSRPGTEQNALTFGAVAFASGMAGYLGFSPLVVAFVAGVIVTNMTPGRGVGPFGEQLVTLERPIYVTFFTIVGASWSLGSERAWAVIPLFVITRLAGKILGARLAWTADVLISRARESRTPSAGGSIPPPEHPIAAPNPTVVAVALTPTSVASVAIVVSARAQYPDLAPFVLTVAIVAGVLSELIAQLDVARLARKGEGGDR